MSGISVVGVTLLKFGVLKGDRKEENLPAAATLSENLDIQRIEETRKLLSRVPTSRLLDHLATVEFLLRWPRLATLYYETKSRRSQQVVEQDKKSLFLERPCFPQLFCLDTFVPQRRSSSLINHSLSDIVTWLHLFPSENITTCHYPTTFFYVHIQHFFSERLILRLGKCLSLLEREKALPAPEVALSEYDRWRGMEPVPVVPNAELSSIEWQQFDRGILDLAKVCLYAFKNLSCAWIVDMSPRNINLATSPPYYQQQWNKAISYLYVHFTKYFEQQNGLWIAGVSDEWLDLDTFLETTRRYDVPCRLYYKDEWVYSDKTVQTLKIFQALEQNAIQLLILYLPHLWLSPVSRGVIQDPRILWQVSIRLFIHQNNVSNKKTSALIWINLEQLLFKVSKRINNLCMPFLSYVEMLSRTWRKCALVSCTSSKTIHTAVQYMASLDLHFTSS